MTTATLPKLELAPLKLAAKHYGLILHQSQQGRIHAEVQHFDSARAVSAAFLRLAGPGWLQTVESSDIRVTQSDDCFADEAVWSVGECPLLGERVSSDGLTSTHLMTDETTGGWKLVSLTTDTSGDSGLLLEQRFLGRADLGKLRYQVGWTPVTVGCAPHAHRELRPTAYRFLGFIS